MLTVPSTAALFAGNGPASGNPDDYTHGPEMLLTGRQAILPSSKSSYTAAVYAAIRVSAVLSFSRVILSL